MTTRRCFLKMTGAAAVSAALGKDLRSAVAAGQKSRVVVVRSEAMMMEGNAFNENAIDKALEAALCQFGGTKRAPEMLAQYIKPDDVVGLKINANFGQRMNATKVELVNSLCRLLAQAGVKENNIIIWDRCVDELEGCGYEINRGKRGVRCLASLTRKVHRGGKPQVGFCEEEVKLGDVVTRYAKLAIEECSVIINMPVLKSFGEMGGRILGITGALKSHIGSIEVTSENVDALHADGCRKSVPDVYSAEPLRQKTKLAICDSIFPLFHHGPGDDPRYHERYNALIVAEDPVAADTVGLDILNGLRAARGVDTVQCSYLAASGQRGLGANEPERIEVLEIGG